MGGFFLVHRDELVRDPALVAKLGRSFSRRGFRDPQRLDAGEFELYRYDKLLVGSDYVVQQAPDKLAVAVGTFFYQGRGGSAALRLVADDYRSERLDWSRLSGTFCLILVTAGTLTLLCDRYGSYRIYHNRSSTIYTTSLPALAEALPSLTVEDQAVFEYLFLGSPLGRKTLLREIVRTPTNSTIDLCGQDVVERALPSLSVETEHADFDDLLDKHIELLRQAFAPVVNVHGDCVCTALSGGYDSRLMLALLRDQGVQPRVYVYGRPQDADVQVALEIARGEGFAIEHVDRSSYPDVSPDQLRQIVSRNFDALDVLPLSGLLENGSELATREERACNGELMLNGIGGEVYRRPNLDDRKYRLREVVWRFCCGFDPNVLTSRFEEETYCATIEAELRKELGVTTPELTSLEAEDAFLKFFFRSWAGHNTSVNNALSWALTPFRDDVEAHQEARRLPYEMRCFGRFEAALIDRLDPRLANYPSAYGHPFNVPPNPEQQKWERKWAERNSAAFLHQLQPKQRTGWAPELSRAHLAELFDPEFPRLCTFIAPHHVTDPGLFRRICTLEYALERFDVDVKT